MVEIVNTVEETLVLDVFTVADRLLEGARLQVQRGGGEAVKR